MLQERKQSFVYKNPSQTTKFLGQRDDAGLHVANPYQDSVCHSTDPGVIPGYRAQSITRCDPPNQIKKTQMNKIIKFMMFSQLVSRLIGKVCKFLDFLEYSLSSVKILKFLILQY